MRGSFGWGRFEGVRYLLRVAVLATRRACGRPWSEDAGDAVFAAYGRALGPIDTGYTDTPDSTSLHVPSIGLIAPGDVVYNSVHRPDRAETAETTTHTRLEWVDALDRLEALVLPGRRRRTQEPSRRRPA
jgi:hypothetical protein